MTARLHNRAMYPAKLQLWAMSQLCSRLGACFVTWDWLRVNACNQVIGSLWVLVASEPDTLVKAYLGSLSLISMISNKLSAHSTLSTRV